MMLLRSSLWSLAVAVIGLTAFAIAQRVAHPFELEWMEGATVVHVQRLLAGQPLYVAPSVTFVPFAYPPLYFYVSAAAAWFAGPGFLPLRIVSIAASAATMCAIVAIVRRTSGTMAAVVAAAAFAGAYPLSDGWFDVGRVDALYVALLALVYALAVRATTARGWAVAGAAAGLALLAKQPALLAVAPLVAYLLFTDRRAALWFGGALAAVAGGATVAINLWTGGWYAYYVLELPRLRVAVSARPSHLLSFWTSDVLPFGIAVAMGGAVVVARREWRHAALAGGLVLSAWVSRLEGGAWNNAVMPAYLALAVLLGISLRKDAWRPALRAALACGQLAWLLFDPRPFVPTASDRADGDALIALLRAQPPPVLLLDHGYWATQAGLPEHAHGWAVTDVVWADRGSRGVRLEQEMRAAIESRTFGAIILDDEKSWFDEDVRRHYRRVAEVRSPAPVSGAPRRPRSLYVPIR